MSASLDDFLSIASAHLNKDSAPKRSLTETDLFSKENCEESNTSTPNKKLVSRKKLVNTLIHTGDTDSSDDEDNKYYEERQYNDSGRDIKHLLKSSPSVSRSSHYSTATWKSKPNNGAAKEQIIKKQDVYTDPVFGLRIVNPLVSFTTLKERMTGREAIGFSRIKKFVSGNISEKNWVLAGVVVSRSPVKTSQKGSQFLIWTLSDLKDDIKTVSVFLFSSAYRDLWKTTTGTVVGILNPNIFEKRDNNSKHEASFSVDNVQKVMILGQSKDLGTCKSRRKNGEQCTSIVNINRCEYCIYHIKKEYQKCSIRSELQSNFSGKGLTALRNKVLGKNEVFYAGKSYMAIPAKRNKKMERKDENRLQALCSYDKVCVTKPKKSGKNNLKAAANIEVTHKQRLKDLTLLEKLGGNSNVKSTFNASHSAEPTLETSNKMVSDVLSKLRQNAENKASNDNSASSEINLEKKLATNQEGLNNKSLLLSSNKEVIDLNAKVTPNHVHRAKLNALKYIQKNGPLKREDPNASKKSDENRKRTIELEDQGPSKKQKTIENEFLSDRFKKMMAATSKHLDLLDNRDNEEKDKYFHKLEMKEQMEEKMVNTFKVPCKAVSCLKCKYTNFSASQFCKDNKHPLKVFDAVKRFFKCGNCQNRTVSLDVVPTTSCKNCGAGKWERTGMMKEKKAEFAHKLSIRGGEQKFVNSVAADANLDLLVPDE